MRRWLVVALALVLGMVQVPAAHAAMIVPTCLVVVAAGQSAPCQWTGTITVSSTWDTTKTTTFPPGINEHGGTELDQVHQTDTTTIQVAGDTGTASRQLQLDHTITQHLLPGAQCGVAQPLTYGTHDKTYVEKQTANGSAQVDVLVDIDPSDGTYTVGATRPSPPTTDTRTFKETWAICNAPAPQDSTETATTAAGDPVPLPLSGQGTVDPNNPQLLDGSTSETDGSGTTTTITWHLTGSCGGCDALQASVDAANAALQADNAGLNGVLDQLNAASSLIIGEAPELAGQQVSLQTALAQLAALYQNGPPDGSDPSQSYAAAVAAWLQGSASDLTLLEAMTAGPNGPRPAVANVVALMIQVQGLEAQVAAQADRLAEAQAQLAICQAGGITE
jgi:hypothetical protein